MLNKLEANYWISKIRESLPKSIFHKIEKSWRQVQYVLNICVYFVLIFLILNHMNQVEALRCVSYNNVACRFFFYNSCRTWFVKISEGTKGRLIHEIRHFPLAWHCDISWPLWQCIDNYSDAIKSNQL